MNEQRFYKYKADNSFEEDGKAAIFCKAPLARHFSIWQMRNQQKKAQL